MPDSSKKKLVAKKQLPSTRFELMISALLVLRLTTWPRRRNLKILENVGSALGGLMTNTAKILAEIDIVLQGGHV